MKVTYLAIPHLGLGAEPFALEMPCMGIAYPEPGECAAMHKHTSCEVHYVKNGELELQIGKQVHRITQGTIFFVNAGVEHEQRFIRKSTVYYFPVMISQYRQTPTRSRSVRTVRTHNGLIPQLLTSSWCIVSSTETTRQCFERIRRAAGNRLRQQATHPLNTCFATIMDAIARHAQRISVDTTADVKTGLMHVDPKIRDALLCAIRSIERDYPAALTVTAIARNACMSLRSFQREFVKAIGMTPLGYLMEIRLRKSLEMLRETDTKIDAIMSACGFRSREHFYKYFARRIGASPESYRRNSTRPTAVFK